MVLHVATAAAADDAVRLLYRLPLHHTSNYVCRSQMTQQFAVMNESVESHVAVMATVRSEVIDRIMNEATLDLHVDSLTVTTHVRGSGASESSDTLVRLPRRQHLQRVLLTPDGTTQSVDAARAGQQPGQQLSDSPQDVMLLLENSRILEQLFVRFPTRDVRANQQWSLPYVDTVLAPQGMGQIAVEGTYTYTYMGTADTLGRTCWVVDWSATELEQTGRFARSGVSMTMHGKAQSAGQSLHCVRTGEVLALTSRTHSVLTMTSADMPDVVFPVHTTLVTTIHQQQRRP